MKLVTYEWNFKKFTSQDRLNTLFTKGLIEREVEPTMHGANYTFKTLGGEKIASFYKDNSFGFGTQATGIELKDVTSI